MKTICLILTVISISSIGCTNGYRVYINGFSEIDQPIMENSSFLVMAEPNSRNQILDNRIKVRIEQLLKFEGYTVTEAESQFDYKLTFENGLDVYQTLEYAPLYQQYNMGFYGGYHSGYHFGYTTYFPYYETYNTQWLTLKLIAPAGQADSNDEEVLWIGQAMTNAGGVDPRVVVDYLLVGCLEYVGIDTSRQKSLFIKEDDPRIMLIESYK
jgi:hypothetical protein